MPPYNKKRKINIDIQYYELAALKLIIILIKRVGAFLIFLCIQNIECCARYYYSLLLCICCIASCAVAALVRCTGAAQSYLGYFDSFWLFLFFVFVLFLIFHLLLRLLSLGSSRHHNFISCHYAANI